MADSSTGSHPQMAQMTATLGAHRLVGEALIVVLPPEDTAKDDLTHGNEQGSAEASEELGQRLVPDNDPTCDSGINRTDPGWCRTAPGCGVVGPGGMASRG